MARHQQPRLGIDFGRVIQGGGQSPDGPDTAFLDGDVDTAMASPPVPGVIQFLPGLIELFGGRAWIVSKCGPRIQERTLQWLEHHQFWDVLGIPRTHIRFCRRRPDKAIHCTDLRITHFIDDRLSVHQALRPVVQHLYLFGPQGDTAPEWLSHTLTWTDVDREVRTDMASYQVELVQRRSGSQRS